MSYLGKRKATSVRARRAKYTSRVGRPMIGRNSGPGRSGFKANFFRLQRAYKNEMGYVDVASATYPLDSAGAAGSVKLLNTVAQGASVNQRIGKKIVLKGLQCRGYVQGNSNCDTTSVSYLIVYDKRPTGANPSVTDILMSADPKSMNNDANAGRFRILKRVDLTVIGNDSAFANLLSETRQAADFFLDLKGLPTTYKAAATGAIGDIEEGALYLVTVGDEAAGTGAAGLTSAFRLRFVDV